LHRSEAIDGRHHPPLSWHRGAGLGAAAVNDRRVDPLDHLDGVPGHQATVAGYTLLVE